jgi:hypothetical protein
MAHIRTTVDLDRGLLERAKAALGAPTYRETITRALHDAVARADLSRILETVDRSDATWSVKELLAYRRAGHGHAR